jgi:hypothetical protein
MGLFWDLIQQGQISNQQDRAQSLEQRVGQLEQRVERQQQLILKLLQRLEETLVEDIDGDGRVG